jgi:hypothetical protein
MKTENKTKTEKCGPVRRSLGEVGLRIDDCGMKTEENK